MLGLDSKPVKKKIINRDPNNQLSFNGLSLQSQTRLPYSKMALSSRDGRASQRGATARAAINYERMSRLGSGEAAKQLQKNAFAKLKGIALSETRRDFKLTK